MDFAKIPLWGYYGQMKQIYLDNAAATPISGSSLSAVMEAMRKFSGNPSGIHKEGRSARAVFEVARAGVAESLHARPDEIIFTSGATEANNMAIIGAVKAARAGGILNPHIIVSSIEHPSVLEVARNLERENVRVDYLPVDSSGLIDTRELRKLITAETVLVSIMYANNEIGTIEPIADIAKEIRHARKTNESVYPYFHTDAAQAANYLDINVLRLGVEMMTISSGKTYGPRGVGALFVKRGVRLNPLMYGGEHENGRRPGTETVALAVGFAVALKEAQKMSAKESKRIKKLRDTLAVKILKKVMGASVNGLPATAVYRSKGAVGRWQAGNLDQCLPNILNISFDGVESDALVLYLDAVGISASGKSACKNSLGATSHVILAIGESADGSPELCLDTKLGIKHSEQSGAVRFSLGRETKSEDISRVVGELGRLIPLLRGMQINSN